ncbi:MAG: hypothetical protein H7249_14840 [Chitinophagaceae bacterium]|nr:hypothetical protein [Oligoflexus sp.]
MKLFELFQKKPAALETLNWSWLDHRPSIYKFLIEGLDEEGRLLPDHTRLPDEKFVRQRSQLVKIAGARDGYLLLHTHRKAHPRQVEEMIQVFARAVETFDEADVMALYEMLLNYDLMPSLELLMEQISRYPLDPSRVFTLAAQLALHSADRQALKFALTVLSFYQLPEVRALALLFSQHDEFTYYALLCLENFPDRFQGDCWMLAQCVHGWGRIHVVRALLPTLGERDKDLKDWLVREGFHNTVADGYLAASVIESGNLVTRLAVKTIDNGLLHATGIILAALLDPSSPGSDMSQVKDGLKLVKEYLRHLSVNKQTHMHQPTLIRLKEIITNDTEGDELVKNLQRKGWADDTELKRLLGRVLGDDELLRSIGEDSKA